MSRAGGVRFGRQRLVRDDQAGLPRLLYRLMGVADPAHYLHYLYCRDALDRFGPEHPRAILDAGSERGDFTVYLAERYPEASVLGIDVDRGHLDRAARYTAPLGLANVSYREQDLARLDAEAAYDLIVCIDVLEHIAEQDEALRRIRRALRPGGVAFLHLPTARTIPSPLARWLRDFHRWSEEEHVARERSAEEMAGAVAAAGLEILEVRETFGYFAGELATSLFDMPYRNTVRNRIVQALLAPVCRLLVLADRRYPGKARFAVAITARAPGPRSGAEIGPAAGGPRPR